MIGTQPDGSAGHPKISTDVTYWHRYHDGDDFENPIDTPGTYNVLSGHGRSFR